MAEWAALGTVANAVGTAVAVYGTYQDFFGPAKKEVNWNEYIIASEKRIIRELNKQTFQRYKGDMMFVSKWWEDNCVDFLRKHPISPENMPLFDRHIGQTLDERLVLLERAIEYLSKEAPGDYGTYGTLVTAHSLHFVLLSLVESSSIASTGKHSASSALSKAILSAIEDVKGWPARYYAERPTHLNTEIETKYSRGGGILGRPGEKRPTGWYIMHDEVNYPPVGTFEGKRLYRSFPNKKEMVKERFDNSEVATLFIPQILGQWEDLYKKAVKAENTLFWSPIKSTTVVLPRV